MITLDSLQNLKTIRHGFLTREGGVSEGIFASLNCGFGSSDRPERVAENRRRAVFRAGLGESPLVTVHQIHSADVVCVVEPWQPQDAPQADALVTKCRGIGLGILTADCVPVLFADPAGGIVGAAHAGWRGALSGILEATIAAMLRLGARPDQIRAAIGPAIQQQSYEVGPEFPERFTQLDVDNSRFFRPAPRYGHFLFDLPAFVETRLKSAGISAIGRTPLDTLGNEQQFFSYRRATLRGENGYGRELSIIAIAP